MAEITLPETAENPTSNPSQVLATDSIRVFPGQTHRTHFKGGFRMSKTEYVVVSFNLEPEVWHEVKAIARKNDRKGGDQLRAIVKEWLKGRK